MNYDIMTFYDWKYDNNLMMKKSIPSRGLVAAEEIIIENLQFNSSICSSASNNNF